MVRISVKLFRILRLRETPGRTLWALFKREIMAIVLQRTLHSFMQKISINILEHFEYM